MSIQKGAFASPERILGLPSFLLTLLPVSMPLQSLHFSTALFPRQSVSLDDPARSPLENFLTSRASSFPCFIWPAFYGQAQCREKSQLFFDCWCAILLSQSWLLRLSCPPSTLSFYVLSPTSGPRSRQFFSRPLDSATVLKAALLTTPFLSPSSSDDDTSSFFSFRNNTQ